LGLAFLIDDVMISACFAVFDDVIGRSNEPMYWAQSFIGF